MKRDMERERENEIIKKRQTGRQIKKNKVRDFKICKNTLTNIKKLIHAPVIIITFVSFTIIRTVRSIDLLELENRFMVSFGFAVF